MAALTIQTITRTSVLPAYAAAASGGDTFANDGSTFIHAKNANVSVTRTLTFASTQTNVPAGTTVTNVTVIIATSSEEMIGPFPKAAFDNSSGAVAITYDDETDVTLGAFKLSG